MISCTTATPVLSSMFPNRMDEDRDDKRNHTALMRGRTNDTHVPGISIKLEVAYLSNSFELSYTFDA